MAKKKQKQEENLENVQEALNTSSRWIEKHQNLLMWILIAILAIVVAVMALNNYYLAPKSNEANEEVAKAVVYFADNNFLTAVNGDEADCLGFAAIANEYGMFKGGKLAALYAGICYYNLGQYEDAVTYLKKFSGDDLNIAPAAKMKLGDAYVALDQADKAVKEFEAAAKSENGIIAPIALKKAGIAYLSLDNKKAAKQAFQTIKDKYATSAEAQDIDKYIANIAD